MVGHDSSENVTPWLRCLCFSGYRYGMARKNNSHDTIIMAVCAVAVVAAIVLAVSASAVPSKPHRPTAKKPEPAASLQDGFNKVTTGMSQRDVVSLLGSKYETLADVQGYGEHHASLGWKTESGTCSVVFQSGKVTAKFWFKTP